MADAIEILTIFTLQAALFTAELGIRLGIWSFQVLTGDDDPIDVTLSCLRED